MFRLRYIVAAVFVAALAALIIPAQTFALELHVLDVNRVYADSVPAKKADAHLAKVRAVLQKGLADLEKRVADKSKEERERELVVGQRVLEQQMQIEIQAARQAVTAVMLDVVRDWRGKKNVAVAAKGQLLDFSPRMDITDTIIKRMEKKEITFGSLPVVSFKEEAKAEEKPAKKDAKAKKK